MDADKIIRDFPKGIINWYPFKSGARVLIVAEQDDCLKELFAEQCREVMCILATELLEKGVGFTEERFDYIIAIRVLEYMKQPADLLNVFRSVLAENGKLLLGVENRLGLRYFCGDRDPFTERNFDGVENYKRVKEQDRKQLLGRNYSKHEIEQFLDGTGFTDRRFYSVLPGLSMPQLIYAEDYLPTEELGGRYFPRYHHPETVFLEEEYLYTDLIQNGMFHQMANAYLVECSLNAEYANVNQVTISMDRGEENALATIIRRDGKVEKKAVYGDGMSKLCALRDNAEDLKAHGIDVVDAEIVEHTYVMPFVDEEIGCAYFRRIFKEDVDKFIAEVDRFRELILNSSEQTDTVCEEVEKYREDAKGHDLGIILKKGYLDLIPLNCFYVDGRFVFFDQEFSMENCPANLIIFRAIQIIYMVDFEMESILPRKFFWERYQMEETLTLWRKLEGIFLADLRNSKELKEFLQTCHAPRDGINTNRQRMNFSAQEYQHKFVNIFNGLPNKKLILFGSGNFTQKFLAQYADDYPVYAIVDNNESKWGTELEGIKICSTEIFNELEANEYKVIVCIKNYVAVMKQLDKLKVRDYAIFDTNMQYPQKERAVIKMESDGEKKPKKYHVGYIAGVFDLFHIGHLNMFRRAKEQCDYLIAGVVTDEGVRSIKKKEPFIPFKERIEIVRACQYVDEAVEIPYNFGGTKDAYRKYHFDCQFSGSDYIDNPVWLSEKEFLEKQGAEMVFFPYTESTSSTKIQEMITKKML